MAYTIEISGADKTSLLKAQSLSVNKGADNRSDCALSLITTAGAIGAIDGAYVGQDLKVKDGGTVIFGGVIKTVNMTKLVPGTGNTVKLQIDISSNGYSDIPSRRTTSVFYENKYAGEIVSDILTNVLNMPSADESITEGTVSNGAYLTQYTAVCKSVKEVYDELAEASGFKWYIDDTKALNFIAEDTITDAAHDIVEGGAFTDYYINGVGISLDNYRNKQFVKGGTGADGNTIVVAVQDDDEIAARQDAEGAAYSSGVYGNVIDENNIESEADAITAAENALKRYSSAPYTLSFVSYTNDWTAGTKLKVNLPTFGISSDTYYLIESVSLQDTDGVNLQSSITATRRKADDFSTQRSENYVDYFSKLTKSEGTAGTVATAAKTVIDFASATNAGAVSVSSTEATAATKDVVITSRSKIIISFSCEITISGGAANVTAITYIDGAAQTYQPTLYCASAQTYVLTFIDYKEAMDADTYTIAVKLVTDANTGSVAIGHARLVIQVYPQAVPFLSDPKGFTATADGATEIDLAWTNPTESTFTKVELYRHTASLSNSDRAWCSANATLIYNSTGTTYADTGRAASTTYYYKIFAEHTVDSAAYYSTGVTASATTGAVSHQQWGSGPTSKYLPDTPDASSVYPYQLVVNHSDLYLSTAPIKHWTFNGYFKIVTTVGASYKIYKSPNPAGSNTDLEGIGTWTLDSSGTASGTYGDITGATYVNPTMTHANHNIYEYSGGALYLAQTTTAEQNAGIR